MRFLLASFAGLLLTHTAFAQDPKGGAFPRRMLFVQVSEYAYLMPLTHATPLGIDRVRDAATRLALGFRIPATRDNDQLFVLADSAPQAETIPTKEAITNSIDQFCKTTRAHDRVVLYFGAHVKEHEGQAYLIPIDGDLTTIENCVSVKAIYAQLEKLPAAQKIVIWDVSRYNPDHARGRRDPGAMTESLLKLLTTPPPGVQVLVSCSANERSLEYSAPRGAAGLYAGSAYVDALRQAASDDRTANAKATPSDAIPIEAFHKAASKTVGTLSKQTPAFAGTAPKEPAPHDAKAPPAKRFEFLINAKEQPQAKAIFDELTLPSVFSDKNAIAKLPFADETLKPYVADISLDEIAKNVEKYPLRGATLRALQTVRDSWVTVTKERRTNVTIQNPITERTKKLISDSQQPIAEAIANLEAELERLEAVADKREKETKRWQAHYDYARAEIQFRLVLLAEYNLAMARVRTESLPDLPPGATGWRLVLSEKLQAKTVRKLFDASQETFNTLAKTHKGTPWEVLAKRSLAVIPGLQWEPVVPEGK